MKDEKNVINNYHKNQFERPYQSTLAFDAFLSKHTNLRGVKVLDLACGGGANVYYFAKKYRTSFWWGIDIDESLFKYFIEYGVCIDNATLICGDWFSIDNSYVDQFDGVISLQTLSWLSEYQKPLDEICKLNPKWIALSSLFYEGDIEYIIKSRNYLRPKKDVEYSDAFYNIYSIPRIKKYLHKKGYKHFWYEPFDIEIDLPKPNSMDWGTYTINVVNGKRLQISAALLMPWYFIFASK